MFSDPEREAVPADVAGQTCAVGGSLNDPCNRVRSERVIGDSAAYPHGPEDQAAINIGNPAFESANRAGRLIGAAWNADLAAQAPSKCRRIVLRV